MATVVATPVKRINGVISKNFRHNYELEGSNPFIPVDRGSLLDHPHAYHLINTDERRGLVRKSPLVNIISNAPDQDDGSIVDGSRHLTKRSALPPFIPGIIKPKKFPKKVPLVAMTGHWFREGYRLYGFREGYRWQCFAAG